LTTQNFWLLAIITAGLNRSIFPCLIKQSHHSGSHIRYHQTTLEGLIHLQKRVKKLILT